MGDIKINNLLISGSCNSEYENFDWFGQIVAYGCDNLVYIYDTDKIKILCTLKGHKGRINCVRFFDNGKILSVCNAGIANIWENTHFDREKLENYVNSTELHSQWNISSSVVLKKRNIIQYSLLKNSENEYFSVMLTTKSDLNLVRLTREDATQKFEFEILETLDFGNNLLECSSLIKFNGKIYAAVSGSDFKIHLYQISENPETKQPCLEYLNSLTGHEDKISALDFINLSEHEENGPCFLASGSKDNYIKVWKLCTELDDSVMMTAMKRNIYRIGENYIYLESSLLGHSDSISSVQWTFKPSADGSLNKGSASLILLSSSLDFSIQIWEREEKSQVRNTTHFRLFLLTRIDLDEYCETRTTSR